LRRQQAGFMQLSILIATNRTGLLACSRIAQACSWASPNIEVIVRDNSGDAQKREFLAQCRRDHCNIVIAEPCDALTNFSEILRLANGEFVFFPADDDFCFDRAIEALPDIINQSVKNSSVVGVTGHYMIETSKGSSVAMYQGVDSSDVVARVSAYLEFSGPNVLAYSVLRRETVQRVFALLNMLPGFFSFHDQIGCLLYLLNGKFVTLNRLLYLYDIGVWETSESGQKRDLDFYVEAGFDPAINALHWFLCGFEGAVLVRNAHVFPNHPPPLRQAIADRWFSAMFVRFQGHARTKFESRLTGEAEKLRTKLLQSAGRLLFPDLLNELCDFIALSSKDKAQAYFEFWDAVINGRNLAMRHADIPAAIYEP
jgi:glycosyltransferase involved in cell wall biosynthesis